VLIDAVDNFGFIIKTIVKKDLIYNK